MDGGGDGGGLQSGETLSVRNQVAGAIGGDRSPLRPKTQKRGRGEGPTETEREGGFAVA